MNKLKLEKAEYANLNPKAKEMYNFSKVSAQLADYGFTSMWLNNDWNGADFIAVHYDGLTDIKIQLKGGLFFNKKFIGKNLYICFICRGEEFYLYPHDDVLKNIEYRISDKKWISEGTWFSTKLTKENKVLLQEYKL